MASSHYRGDSSRDTVKVLSFFLAQFRSSSQGDRPSGNIGLNRSALIAQISATDLKAMMDRGGSLELVDVRTEEERAIAQIQGSRLLNQEGHDYLVSLDRNTVMLFQCHHGIRSQSAAEYFLREQGFSNLYNLRGGIDAWSQLVDPSVPRY